MQATPDLFYEGAEFHVEVSDLVYIQKVTYLSFRKFYLYFSCGAGRYFDPNIQEGDEGQYNSSNPRRCGVLLEVIPGFNK